MSSTAHVAGTTSQPPQDDAFIRKSDIEALIKALNENYGNISSNVYNALKSLHCSSQTARPLIIDLGVSHHMIRDVKLISDVQPSLGSFVIADGDRIPIEGIGNLKLFDKKSKALYMPTFTSNLLSVKKATTDLNCHDIFSPHKVFFQNIETSKMIGNGVSKRDFYLLEDTKLRSDFHATFTSTSVLASNVL